MCPQLTLVIGMQMHGHIMHISTDTAGTQMSENIIALWRAHHIEMIGVKDVVSTFERTDDILPDKGGVIRVRQLVPFGYPTVQFFKLRYTQRSTENL